MDKNDSFFDKKNHKIGNKAKNEIKLGNGNKNKEIFGSFKINHLYMNIYLLKGSNE